MYTFSFPPMYIKWLPWHMMHIHILFPALSMSSQRLFLTGMVSMAHMMYSTHYYVHNMASLTHIACTHHFSPANPAYTGRLTNVVLMLVQRRRRWPNIKTTLVKRPVFAGIYILGTGYTVVQSQKKSMCLLFFQISVKPRAVSAHFSSKQIPLALQHSTHYS